MSIIKIPIKNATTMTHDMMRSEQSFSFCPSCGHEHTLFRSVYVDYEGGAEFLCVNCRRTFTAFPGTDEADFYDNRNIDYILSVTANNRYEPLDKGKHNA